MKRKILNEFVKSKVIKLNYNHYTLHNNYEFINKIGKVPIDLQTGNVS